VKSIYKLLIGLSLTALPALCGSYTINSVNASNNWYGFYWNSLGGNMFGATITNAPATGDAYLSTDGTTTVLGSSPSGGPAVTGFSFDFGFPVQITVTALGPDGSTFAVYDNSTLIFDTSASTNTGATCYNNPATCAADGFMSHGTFTLAAGANLITMVDLTDSVTSGQGAFRLDALGDPPAVPEPATFGLMGLGLGGLLLGWRRKRA
jgi:hypothetical protein